MSERTTFVCAIESGRLEDETLLMVQSLRRFGGSLADTPVLAVLGRKGPPLRRGIREPLEQLGVRIVQAPAGANRYPWFGYSNKIMAIQTADRLAETPIVTWLDSDVLITAAPEGLLLREDEDFAARTEPLNAAVTNTDRRNENYWIALCALVGVDYARLPWVADEAGERLAYFNSGVFSWRRTSGFAEAYVSAFWRLLDSRIALPSGSFFSADQVTLSPVMTKLGLRWRHLSHRDHHMIFPPLLAKGPSIAGSAVLHYSRSMQPDHLPILMARINAENPELGQWLVDRSVTVAPESRGIAMRRWALRKWRGLHWALFAHRIRIVT